MPFGDGQKHEVPDEVSSLVRSFQSSPERTVFTEDGNADGWISTDVTVELRR